MLIPGYLQGTGYVAFYVYGDDQSAEWTWPMCLGVALSIAGALTSAYKEGFAECWDYMAGRDGR
jgi:hypothetical protein